MNKLRFGILLILLSNVVEHAFGQGTNAFTYQGRLTENGSPANGFYDFRAQLYDAAGPPDALVSITVTNVAVRVNDGLFVLNLDFGAPVFSGAARWLSIDVRTNNDLNFIHLSPRQRLSPTPYAIYSGTAGGLPSGLNQTFTGAINFNPASGPPFNVSSSTLVPNLNADLLDGLNSSAFVLKGGDTMSGNLTIANPATLNFGSSVRQMINLWGNVYGIGVQAASLYFRSDDGFAWFRDGVHATGTFDPGPGGNSLMTLTPEGQLSVFNSSGLGIYCLSSAGDAVGAVYGQCTSPTGEVYGVRGSVISPSGSAIYGANSTAGGIAVHGVHGTGTGSRTTAGVYGESTTSQGNGVVGVANNGTAAFGVWGKSTTGYGGRFDGPNFGVYASSGAGFAGHFAGALRIEGNSAHGKPFLQVHETEDGDYARIQLQVANRPLWHVSVGGGDNSLVFFNAANSIVTSISETGILTTKVLTITGGADIAEPFEMSHSEITKGSVVVIDEENPGKLKLSNRSYDTRVAGVVSGAGGVQPGLTLQQSQKLEGGQQVALTGRVYVYADASVGVIKPGDLLTSSDTLGHAMRVSDHLRAQGAILGKAMTGLSEGRGLVLVLVTLQ